MLVLVAPLIALVLAQDAARPVTQPADLLDLWNLAKPHAVVERQTSSFDRTGGNDDGFSGRFSTVDPATSETVLLEAEGPGCVHRIWSANPKPETTLRFFFDGEPSPRFVAPFPALFDGSLEPFLPPLSERTSGGSICYLPLPFGKSIRIVARGPVYFFQVNWGQYPEGTAIESFDPTATVNDPLFTWTRGALERPEVADISAQRSAPLRCAKHFIGAEGQVIPTLVPVTFPLDVGNGHGMCAEIAGPGVVTAMFVEAKTDDPIAWRRALLRVFCDGASEPCVEAPLSDFFGAGYPGAPARSVAFTKGDGEFECRFVMPFGKSLRAELVNFDREHGLKVDLRFTGVSGDVAEFGGMRFHARWRSGLTRRGQFHDVLNAEGRGHFVGCTITMSSPRQLFFLEGDEQAIVDGRDASQWTGTGTEDYFNCGWYFNTGVVNRPFHGVTHKDEPLGQISAYRLHVADAIPFEQSLQFKIEHGGGNDEPGVEYASVAYWYATQDSRHDLPRVDGERLGPPRKMIGIPTDAFTLEAMKIEPELPRTFLSDLTADVGGIEYAVLDAAHPVATLTFPAKVADRARVNLLCGKTSGKVTFSTRVDGSPEESRLSIDTAFTPLMPFFAGSFSLEHGDHVLHVALDPTATDAGAAFLLAGVRLEPELPFVSCYEVFTTWHLEENGQFEENQGPESAEHDGWFTADADATGYLDLRKFCEPQEHVFTYVRFFLSSPDERRVTLRLGSDDWLAVWVNKVEYLRKQIHRPAAPDQELIEVPLMPGRNEVLMKIANLDGGFGAYARVADPQGGVMIVR